VRTDEWEGTGICSVGYVHTVVRRTAVVGENLLPLVNRCGGIAEAVAGRTHQGAVHPSHLQYYWTNSRFGSTEEHRRRAGSFSIALFSRLWLLMR